MRLADTETVSVAFNKDIIIIEFSWRPTFARRFFTTTAFSPTRLNSKSWSFQQESLRCVYINLSFTPPFVDVNICFGRLSGRVSRSGLPYRWWRRRGWLIFVACNLISVDLRGAVLEVYHDLYGGDA
jgi:hypothetical protein